MEELVLTDPVVVPEKVTSKYKIMSLTFSLELPSPNLNGIPGAVIIELKDNNDERFTHRYTDQVAVDFIKFANTANFSVNSMNKRVLQKLSADGVLPGTVVGTPDPPVVEF